MHSEEAIHAVNAVLWQPGQKLQTFTNRPTDYYTPWPQLGLGLLFVTARGVGKGSCLTTTVSLLG